MKYLSLVAVILFIAFTFWFSKRSEELTISQMNKMNSLIAQYMTQAVQQNQPQATEIEFSNISTEIVTPGKKLRANFSFSYKEPNEQGEIEKVFRKGSFIITSEDGDQWTAQIEEAGDVKVEFLEPFSIDGDPTAEPTQEETPQESAAQ